MTEEKTRTELLEMPILQCDAVKSLDRLKGNHLGIIVYNTLQKLGLSSLKLRTNLGYSEEEAVELESILPEINKEETSEYFDELINNPGSSWDTFIVGKNNLRKPVRITNFPWSSSEKPEYTPLLIEDITKETKDSLTGLSNRRSLTEIIKRRIEDSLRHGQNLSIAMLDFDDFKFYNDGCGGGHEIGDRILKLIGDTLGDEDKIRVNDATGRWGGEEFVIVFPTTEPNAAILAIERIRKALKEKFPSLQIKSVKELRGSNGQILIKAGELVSSIGTTFGLISLDELIKFSSIETTNNEELVERLVKAADKLMYWGKNNGKDQIVTLNNVPRDDFESIFSLE